MAVTPEFLAQEIEETKDINSVFNRYIHPHEGEADESFQQRKEAIIAQTMALRGKSLQMPTVNTNRTEPKILDIPIILDCLGDPLTEGYVDSTGNTYDISNIDKIPESLHWQNNDRPVVNRALNDNLDAINRQLLKAMIAKQWIMENIPLEQQNNYLQQGASVSDEDYPPRLLQCPILFDNFNPVRGTNAFIYEDGYSVSLPEQSNSPFTNLPLRKKMGTPNCLLDKLAEDYLVALTEYKQMIQQYPDLQAFVDAKIEEKEQEQKEIHELNAKEAEKEKEAIQKCTRRLAIRAQLELERKKGVDVINKDFQKINQECLFALDRIGTRYPNIEKYITPQAIEQARQDFTRNLDAVTIEALRQYDNVRNAYFKYTDEIYDGVLTADQSDEAFAEQARLHTAQKELEEAWPEIRYRLLLDQARGVSSQPTADLKRVSLRERANMDAKKRALQIHPPFFHSGENSNVPSTVVKRPSVMRDNPNANSSAIERVTTFASQTFSRFFSVATSAENSQIQPHASRLPDDYDYLLKVLLKGDSGVGKSCLLLRFADDIYTELLISTIGVDFKFKTIESNGNRIKLQIWDTEGPERFRAIRNVPRGAHAIIVTFDVTDHESFEHVLMHLKEIDVFSGPTGMVTLAATKCDIPEAEWAVSKEEIRKFAEHRRLNVFFTSAKDNLNVEQLFEAVANSVIQHRPQSVPRPSPS
ncbi:MAG: ras-related protein RABD2a [Gammaproteobacteria bacterium]|nr:ras-related protein RABD2a [Gammaproteobacteria bacterium]